MPKKIFLESKLVINVTSIYSLVLMEKLLVARAIIYLARCGGKLFELSSTCLRVTARCNIILNIDHNRVMLNVKVICQKSIIRRTFFSCLLRGKKWNKKISTHPGHTHCYEWAILSIIYGGCWSIFISLWRLEIYDVVTQEKQWKSLTDVCVRAVVSSVYWAKMERGVVCTS